MKHKTHLGSCLCGSVKFQVTDIGEKMANCHCSMCRKFHGAAFATFGEVSVENFVWLKGKELLSSYRAENGTVRQFCSNCGSSLIFKPANDKNEVVEFSLGCLDSDIERTPDANIFTKYKANWYEITDDLPQFEEGRCCEY